VAHIIEARREGERQRGSDLLASFLDDREALTDAQIADNVIGVIFAARDTTASVLTWMVKFLGDHPAVLKAVIVSSSPCRLMPGTRSTAYVRPPRGD
jgi:(+)-abscisic acid 8'-hydroxylase